MTKRQKLISLSLASAALICLLSAIYLAVGKRKAKSEHSDGVVKHSVEKPADDVLKHWTPEKMREAQPAELPNTDAIKPKKRRSRRSSHTTNSEQG